MLNEQVIKIIDWYRKNRRDLEFRKTNDPYCIWVSEVMAQQTQINTMLPYYIRWIDKYPSFQALANANIDEVYQLWAGLGYYNRARNLVRGAQMIVQEYGNGYPTTYQQWLDVAGVGPYIAAAVSSICFNEKVASIDGNVNRVVSRFLALNLVQGTRAFETEVRNVVDGWLNYCKASELNQALMEMGALVCTKTNPKCNLCPLQMWCKGKENTVKYPIKKKKKENPIEMYKVGYVINSGKVAIQIPPYQDGLMEGYLRLPAVKENFDLAIVHVKHVYSHKTWLLTYDPSFEIDINEVMWVDLKILLDTKKLIVAHMKLLKKFGLIR